LDETVAATKGAMDAAHARRQSHGGSIETEVCYMRERISLLEEIKKELERMRSGMDQANEPAGTPPYMQTEPECG
jgi:hypothetical protein